VGFTDQFFELHVQKIWLFAIIAFLSCAMRRIVPTQVERADAPIINAPTPPFPTNASLSTWNSRFNRLVFESVKHPNGDIDIMHNEQPYACVRDSYINCAGKGLFSCRNLTCSDHIGLYAGHVIGWMGSVPEGDSAHVTTHTPYINTHTRERYCCLVDGARAPQTPKDQMAALGIVREFEAPFAESDWPGTYIHMANDANGPGANEHGLVNNCLQGEDGVLYATRDVPGTSFDAADKHASELLHPYGAEYWAAAK
jgi:hypothetical protein